MDREIIGGLKPIKDSGVLRVAIGTPNEKVYYEHNGVWVESKEDEE